MEIKLNKSMFRADFRLNLAGFRENQSLNESKIEYMPGFYVFESMC